MRIYSHNLLIRNFRLIFVRFLHDFLTESNTHETHASNCSYNIIQSNVKKQQVSDFIIKTIHVHNKRKNTTWYFTGL